MRVSYKWLKTMVDVPEEPRDLVAELIRTGTEVEAVDTVGQAFDHVVTGKVLTKDPHPDSDHMWVTTVDVGAANTDAEGNPQPLQIVCGAQNFNAGDHIVVAMVGAELPGGIKIKKAKLRGIESRGMNCSARELGLSGDHSGIMILPEDAPVGMPFARYADLSDSVLDCEITPNRPDCLSMIGMAREVGAILDEDLHVDLPAIKQEQGAPASDVVEVEIADEGLCDRYVMRVVRNVKVGPSPQWMVERLAAAGVRSINNIVDITNYVMMLTGQPLHAWLQEQRLPPLIFVFARPAEPRVPLAALLPGTGTWQTSVRSRIMRKPLPLRSLSLCALRQDLRRVSLRRSAPEHPFDGPVPCCEAGPSVLCCIPGEHTLSLAVPRALSWGPLAPWSPFAPWAPSRYPFSLQRSMPHARTASLQEARKSRPSDEVQKGRSGRAGPGPAFCAGTSG